MNCFLDGMLAMERGPKGVLLTPDARFCVDERLGFIYPGITAAVAHEAAYWSLVPAEEDCFPAMMTTAFTVHMLSPATVHDGDIIGSGEVIRRGRSKVVAQGFAHQGEKLMVHAVVSFVPMPGTVRN
ncbi:hypothetical protein [Streptomyces roseochromogenus]|uniref:Thioesterase n=1 Tax=Streptomyces roseochromogenus subsp. oscitans DS 12.976 TaxID=1352936 RepID=V6K5B3_STRRC|nr:hypothetical protein [Streptomyces roseochromogenus]EST27312.1 hypothetical protein M878_25270 [Streptomyces roseochromogenus subsp. oscitans DS 12.976]